MKNFFEINRALAAKKSVFAQFFLHGSCAENALNPDGEPTVSRQSRLRNMEGKASVNTTVFWSFLSNCLRSASVLRPFRLRLDSLSLPSRFRVLAKYAAAMALFMCLGIGEMWAYNLERGYLKYSFNGSESTFTVNDNDAYTQDLGTLTGTFAIKGVYIVCSTGIGDEIKGNQLGYSIYNVTDGDGSAQYRTTTSTGTYGYGDLAASERQDSWEGTINIASNTSNSGIYYFKFYFDAWFNSTNAHIAKPGYGNVKQLKYTIMPPAVSGFTVTPTGKLGGSGTSADPYIVPYGGSLTLALSGSKGRDDAHSSLEYNTAGSWNSTTSRTISNITSSGNVTLQMRCHNSSSDDLSGEVSSATIYYKALKVHEPGTYEKATGSGGYGKTLRTYNGTTTGNVDKQFELYYFQASSSKGILYAGESSPFTLFSNAVSNTSITATDGWIEVNARAYENSGGTQKDEMSNGNSSISTQAAKLATSSNHIQLAIFGYDQFTFFGKDLNANDATKQFLVKIDGTTQSITHQTTDNTAYRFNLDGGRHLIEIFGTGTNDDSHENNFRAFSLRPAAPTISATSMAGYTYNQGDVANTMTVTATPVVAGHTLTYTWYKNSSATMSGATQVQSSTSSSYTPSTETAGGLYYVCVVSEEGCNTSTTAWSGLITVNAVCTPLGAVAGLTCNDKSTTELQFAWAAFGATATGVTVTLYSDEDCTDQVATVNKANDANVHRFTGLEPGTTYWCTVQTKGDGSTYCADGGISKASATTNSCTAVAAPTGLSCTAHTGTSLTFGWTKASNASTYTAKLYSDSGCETQVASQDLGDVNTVTFSTLTANTTYYCKVQSHGDGSTYCAAGGITSAASGTTDNVFTVTYNVNGGGSVSPSSATQASAGASLTLPTPTWTGYTFNGWYNAGSKIGNGGASYTPTANITLYAYWTDDISGKVFSYIDNNYGDKFQAYDASGWISDNGTNIDKTITNATTGVQFKVEKGGWDKKTNAISALAKFFNGTSSMSVIIPTGKIATVKISYGAYSTSNRLTIGGSNQTQLSNAIADGNTNAQVYSNLTEVTLNNQTGTLTLGSSTGNIYIGRVSATITGYTVTYAKGSADGASGDTFTGTKTAGSSFTLSSSSSAFTRDGYTYDGWSTNEDGSTKDYNLGGSYTTDAPVTLYPHWVAVCSGPNGGSATYTAGGYTYEQGDDANTMSLTGMAASNGGALSYQWYKTTSDYAAGEAIDDATSNTYTPSTAVVHAANWYYFCVVTEAGCATTYRSALSGAIVVNPAVCFNLTLKTDGSAGDVNEGTAITTSNYASTLTGGVARVGGSESTTAYSTGANGGLTFSKSTQQIDVDLDYLTQVGSIITVKFYLSGLGSNYGIKINGQAKWTVSSSSGSQTLSYTLTGSDTELIGKSHLTIARNAGSPVFQSITVANCSGTEAPCFSISDAGKNGSTTLSADTVTNAIIDGTIRGGQVKWTGGSYDANDADGIIFNADDDEITITLWGDKALDEGSVISITQHGNSSTGKATGFKISGNSMSPATYTNSSAKEENTQTYTVPEGSALIGKQSFTIKWTGSNQVYLKAMNITGCGEYSCTAPTSPSIAISDDDGDNDYHLSSSELTFTASATGTDGSTTYTWYRCQTADDIATTKASGTPIQAASTSTTYTISFLKDGNLAAGGDEAIYLCKISNGTGCDVWAQTSLDVTPAASVSITYHLNGASWVGGYTAPSSYRPGAEGATLPIASNMVNTGYTFGGWYDNSGLTGSAVIAISTSDYGDKEYWAKWTENTYTITYDKNGGTGSDMSTTVGHYVTLSTSTYTAPSGKLFLEWNTQADGNGISYTEGEEIELTADLNLYAIWATEITATWNTTTPNTYYQRGGNGYTVTVYLDQADWDASGNKDDLDLTATEGVTITDVVKSINGSGKAQVTANFAITPDVPEEATKITFTLSVPAAGSYAAVALTHDVTLTSCAGGGALLFSQNFDAATEVAYAANTAVTITTSSGNNIVGNTVASQFTYIACNQKSSSGIAINSETGGNSKDYSGFFGAYYPTTGGKYSLIKNTNFAGSAPTAMKVGMKIWFKQGSSSSDYSVTFAVGDGFSNSNDKPASSNVHSGFSIKNNSTATLTEYATTTNIYSSGISQGSWLDVTWIINNTGSSLSYSDPKSGTSSVDNDKFDVWIGETRVIAGQAAVTASKTLQNLYIGDPSGKNHEFRLDNVAVYDLNGGGGNTISPTLTWETDLSGGVTKYLGQDADFTHTASTTSNTLGEITYSSSNTGVATVNASGRVHMVGTGTTTITATLAASGCYNGATATYTLTVNEVPCEDVAATIVDGSGNAIPGNAIEKSACTSTTLQVTGYTVGDGAAIEWYKDGVQQGAYNNQTSITITDAGEWSAFTTAGGAGHCKLASVNSIVITNTSSLSVSNIVNSWYVKNGRRTPDIALWQTAAATNFTVKNNADDATITSIGGCEFYKGTDGVIYLMGTKPAGTAPSDMSAGDLVIKVTVSDACNNLTSSTITIHQQAATDRESIAFVVDGTEKGAFDAENEDHSVNTALFQFLDHTAGGGAFDLTGQNIYSTTDEKAIREHYSQFDAIVITDDPSTKKPSEKTYKTKGYVNAFGTMIDVRPILTMEAYVSALANWSCVKGNPSSPNPRQYEMRLQCKDHEIYSGLPAPSPGTNVWSEVIDGEEYHHVIMVDSTKSPYNKHAYNDSTSQYPALQGFSSEAMGDLLGLGVISGGALHAGIERQAEPAARMMLLGLNAKALPNALTAEGKKVIENAITYLLKTNMEDVDDCSNYFIGGTSGKEKDWGTLSNWTKTGALPNYETRVRILAPCEVTGITAKVAQVDIATSGTSKNKVGTCNGSLTIKPDGALVVGGKVRVAEAPYFNNSDLKPTGVADLTINTDEDNQACLILDNSDASTKATVNLYSLGRKPSSYLYQYFAIPMEYLPVNPTFANEAHGGTKIYTYVWTEGTSSWTRRKYYDDLFAFEGLGITTNSTDSHMDYTMTGNLASTAEREIMLTYDGAGNNIIGNSYTAPINIASLVTAFASDGNVTKTVYIYSTGRDAVKGTGASGSTETAGQWLAIPMEAAAFEAWGGLKVIPAMQAFLIQVTGETSMTLNYDAMVRSNKTGNYNEMLHAPQRFAEKQATTLTRLRVADSQTHTDLYLFEGDQFSEAFDNGWEAQYMEGDGRSAQLYAMASEDKMAVLASPELEGTQVGFTPGQETAYTFSFAGGTGTYYLNDIKAQKSALIQEGNTYSFEYENGDAANRFYISKKAIDAPAVGTGVGNTDVTPKVQKFIFQNKLYILRNGVLYDATGKVVK